MTGDSGHPRIFFLHANPQPHESHRALAWRLPVSAGAAMSHIGASGWPTAVRYAWRMARSDDWDVLLAEDHCHEAILLRVMDRRHRRRVLLDSTNATLRFGNGGFTPLRARRLRFEWRAWDAIVSLSKAGDASVREYLGPGVELARWTPPVTLGDPFGEVVARHDGPLVSLMGGDEAYRVWCKGLDRVAAISRACQREGWGPVTVYGPWSEKLRAPFADDAIFAGKGDAARVLTGAGVLVHPARVDTFAVAVVEAMLAGVPPVVSGAGSGALVADVESRLVVSSERDDEALDAIRWVRNLAPGAFRSLGERLRARAQRYVDEVSSPGALDDIRRVLGFPPAAGASLPVDADESG